ncbi:hypothetical protein [Longirhabdus pacifica]|uniref:hypothetical protein n=1 Tax=Longirhabdus pacifica TaxID=2305227 RepID=UPI001008CB22|nr:hypothetical protein [Longirhabdus pacifica]
MSIHVNEGKMMDWDLIELNLRKLQETHPDKKQMLQQQINRIQSLHDKKQKTLHSQITIPQTSTLHHLLQNITLIQDDNPNLTTTAVDPVEEHTKTEQMTICSDDHIQKNDKKDEDDIMQLQEIDVKENHKPSTPEPSIDTEEKKKKIMAEQMKRIKEMRENNSQLMKEGRVASLSLLDFAAEQFNYTMKEMNHHIDKLEELVQQVTISQEAKDGLQVMDKKGNNLPSKMKSAKRQSSKKKKQTKQDVSMENKALLAELEKEKEKESEVPAEQLPQSIEVPTEQELQFQQELEIQREIEAQRAMNEAQKELEKQRESEIQIESEKAKKRVNHDSTPKKTNFNTSLASRYRKEIRTFQKILDGHKAKMKRKNMETHDRLILKAKIGKITQMQTKLKHKLHVLEEQYTKEYM